MKYILFLFMAFCSSLQAQSNLQNKVDSLFAEGRKQGDKGNHLGAINIYKQADGLIKKHQLGKDQEARVNSSIGYAYINQSKYKEGLVSLKQSAYCFEVDKNTSKDAYCRILYDIAVVSYFYLKQSTDSLCRYATKAYSSAIIVYRDNDPNIARYLELFGLCKFESKDLLAAQKLLLSGYILLNPHRDSFPIEFMEVCGYLATLYNHKAQLDSSIFYARKKLEQAKKILEPNDSGLSEAYYSLAFALNVGHFIESSILYLDSALTINPKICAPKGKAEFFYRGGEYYFYQKNFPLAKHYFIQAGTYLSNNKITDPLEGSCWLWVAGLFMQELKITEAQPYLEKACTFFNRYLGSQNPNSLKVCNMLKELNNLDPSKLDLRYFFQNVPPDDMKKLLEQIPNQNNKVSVFGNYMNDLLTDARKQPHFKELPLALMDIVSKRYDDVIKRVQKLYPIIIPGFLDSLDYYSDPAVNSPTLETNNFLLALLLKAVAYDQIGTAEKNLKKLKYSWHLLEKCDTLMSSIRTNALGEDLGIWHGILNGIYNQMIITSSKIFQATQDESYYNKTLFATERLKAFALLQVSDPSKIASLIPPSELDHEKQLVKNNLKLRHNLAKLRQLRTYDVEEEKRRKIKEKLLIDSLFLNDANLATIRSIHKVKYPKYWEANNEKSIVSVREVMAHLDKETAILSYTCMVDETISILVITNSQNSFFIEKPVAGLKSMVATISGYLAKNPNNLVSKVDYLKAAHKLYQELMVDLPTSIKRLIIVPDSYLHDLPFEALITNNVDANAPFSTYPYLLNNYAISYGYSVTLVADQLKNKVQTNYPNFLLGYSSPGLNDMEPVKRLCEAQHLNYQIRNKRENATKLDLFAQNLETYRIVHISAHGQVPSQTEKLGVRLASGDFIGYGDFYSLNIKADLFLLMACLSGKGTLITGEGVIGLNRALYIAGAKNVLLFRELLNNEANSFFCQKFYADILKQDNQDYSFALQNARKAMITDDRYADPVFWAGYYLIGL